MSDVVSWVGLFFLGSAVVIYTTGMPQLKISSPVAFSPKDEFPPSIELGGVGSFRAGLGAMTESKTHVPAGG